MAKVRIIFDLPTYLADINAVSEIKAFAKLTFGPTAAHRPQ
jgi:hypothetical protein